MTDCDDPVADASPLRLMFPKIARETIEKDDLVLMNQSSLIMLPKPDASFNDMSLDLRSGKLPSSSSAQVSVFAQCDQTSTDNRQPL